MGITLGQSTGSGCENEYTPNRRSWPHVELPMNGKGLKDLPCIGNDKSFQGILLANISALAKTSKVGIPREKHLSIHMKKTLQIHKINRLVSNAASLILVTILLGCSAFRPHRQQVTISTTVPDADIWVNGKLLGKSPLTVAAHRKNGLKVFMPHHCALPIPTAGIPR